MLSPFQFRASFLQPDGTLDPWAQRWMQDLTNAVNGPVTPGPYANDAAAAAGKVAKGKQYFLPSGQVVVRIT